MNDFELRAMTHDCSAAYWRQQTRSVVLTSASHTVRFNKPEEWASPPDVPEH